MTVGGAHLSGGTSTEGGGAGDFDDVTGLEPHPSCIKMIRTP